MKVLFCTDGSKISFKSIENFSNWFKEISADAVSVADYHSIPEGLVLGIAEFEAKCSNSINAILESSKKYLSDLKINAGSLINGCGAVVDYILEIEKKSKYDFLVLGSNGKRGIQKWLGSVSYDVALMSCSSVYISKNQNKCQSILFVVNSDVDYAEDIQKLIKTMCLENKIVHLLAIYDIPQFLFLQDNIDKKWIAQVERAQIKSSLNSLSKYERVFLNDGIKVMYTSSQKGNPEEVTLKYIKDKDIDLVVCSNIKNKPKNNSSLSSFCKRILEYSNSDVLILKNYLN